MLSSAAFQVPRLPSWFLPVIESGFLPAHAPCNAGWPKIWWDAAVVGDTGVKITQFKVKREILRVCPSSSELHLYTAEQGWGWGMHWLWDCGPMWSCLFIASVSSHADCSWSCLHLLSVITFCNCSFKVLFQNWYQQNAVPPGIWAKALRSDLMFS